MREIQQSQHELSVLSNDGYDRLSLLTSQEQGLLRVAYGVTAWTGIRMSYGYCESEHVGLVWLSVSCKALRKGSRVVMDSADNTERHSDLAFCKCMPCRPVSYAF